MAVSCGVGRRRGLDPALLQLRYRPAAAAPIGPLGWEPLYAAGAALKHKQTNKMIEKQGKDEYKVKLALPGGRGGGGEGCVFSHEQPVLKERFYFSF